MINQTIDIPASTWHNADGGDECRFLPYMRTTSHEAVSFWMPWAIKVYPTARQAHDARHRQFHFWRKGLAPEVGETVRVRVRGIRRPFYGYFTEQIEGRVVADYVPHPFPEIKDLPVEYHHAKRRLAALGYDDLHEHNMMFCPRRLRWLAIDFGPMSHQPRQPTETDA